MNTSHTPGPWYYRPEEPCIEGQDESGFNFTIADCGKSYVLPEETKHANAKLIAAAPELLEALQAILDLEGEAVEHNRYGTAALERKVFGAARSAIAKATKGEN